MEKYVGLPICCTEGWHLGMEEILWNSSVVWYWIPSKNIRVQKLLWYEWHSLITHMWSGTRWNNATASGPELTTVVFMKFWEKVVTFVLPSKAEIIFMSEDSLWFWAFGFSGSFDGAFQNRRHKRFIFQSSSFLLFGGSEVASVAVQRALHEHWQEKWQCNWQLLNYDNVCFVTSQTKMFIFSDQHKSNKLAIIYVIVK